MDYLALKTAFTKRLYFTFSLLCWCCLILFGYTFFKADLSLQPIRSVSISDKTSRPPTYLISYADGHEVFFQNQHALAYSAQNKGFDAVINFRRDLLDPDFATKHHNILNVKTGAGLWVWKPQIILQTMRWAPKNAYIIYTDAGFMYVRDIDNLIKMSSNYDVMVMDIDLKFIPPACQANPFPKKIDHKWHISSMQKKPKFIAGGFVLVRNTPFAREFIQAWLDNCTDKECGLTVEFKQGEYFSYDESLLSLTVHKYLKSIKVISKEDFRDYALYHHRRTGDKSRSILWLQVVPGSDARLWLREQFPMFFSMLRSWCKFLGINSHNFS